MAKPKITRTYGPIHFEDLDPRRFEDLIRELIYDLKDWQVIEATGRSGSDDGFDIRAYEKNNENSRIEDEQEGDEGIYPMEGNIWMIQCKREKTIGPTRIKEILNDVDPKNPPYGYILAASANFSKESYDAFRDELRKKGVMEFHLWGKAEIEDMLHFPKNDRILFTFFGISLVSRRRSRATEIRQVINNKNKLYKMFGEAFAFGQQVLLRDSKDIKYPYQDTYKDFKNFPRWKTYNAIEHHTLGLVVKLQEYFAYIDVEKKEYDYTEAANLIFLQSDPQIEADKQRKIKDKVEDYWNFLPRHTQAKFFKNGLIRYNEMLVIDDKGDESYKFPHIFVDFDQKDGPIDGSISFIKVGEYFMSLNGYKRVKKFPASFPQPKKGRLKTKGIKLDPQLFRILKRDDAYFSALYSIDGRYDFFKIGDILPIENVPESGESKYYLQITHVEKVKVKDYLKRNMRFSSSILEEQIGRNPELEEMITIHEFKKMYEFQVKK